jgi:hypothetical protein
MHTPAPSRAGALALATLGLAFTGTTSAASLSYVLDQSDRMADGVGYVEVTISDGPDGAIDFAVRALPPLLDVAGERFGIQKFSFNIAPGTSAAAVDVTGLPDGWRARNGGSLGGFGRFDVAVKSNGTDRVDTLAFSVTGVAADVLTDYISLSTGHVDGAHAFFAARIYGVDIAGVGRQVAVGGSTLATVVPAPASLWLLGSAAGALVAVRRRRQR